MSLFHADLGQVIDLERDAVVSRRIHPDPIVENLHRCHQNLYENEPPTSSSSAVSYSIHKRHDPFEQSLTLTGSLPVS